MPDTTGSELARLPFWLLATYGSLSAASTGMVVYAAMNGDSLFAAAGLLGLIVSLACAPVAVMARRRSALGAATGASSGGFSELAQAIRELNESGTLSDDARRVLNRKRERELLRGAIEEDVSAGDFDAALVLVRELAESFGYRADAEEFRQRIESARFESAESESTGAIEGLDRMITQLRWREAEQEAARITRLYPDSPRVDGMRHRVSSARERYKNELERRFLTAAQDERVDEAMGLLRELDGYLTEAEAEPFQELARGVIGKARENLGVQFKLAVQDKRWRDATTAGEQIISEFPNSRMAAEIRGMIDTIRERAAALR